MANVVLSELDLNFQGHQFETPRTVRAIAKIRSMAFTEVDVRRRMPPL